MAFFDTALLVGIAERLMFVIPIFIVAHTIKTIWHNHKAKQMLFLPNAQLKKYWLHGTLMMLICLIIYFAFSKN